MKQNKTYQTRNSRCYRTIGRNEVTMGMKTTNYSSEKIKIVTRKQKEYICACICVYTFF